MGGTALPTDQNDIEVKIECQDALSVIKFSPQSNAVYGQCGTLLAAASWDGQIMVWQTHFGGMGK
jgi:hypothetical protein